MIEQTLGQQLLRQEREADFDAARRIALDAAGLDMVKRERALSKISAEQQEAERQAEERELGHVATKPALSETHE